jgi:hypothetical protein
MNTKPNFTNSSWNNFNWLLAALALALIVSARAETQPAAIPFSDIGARATANYQGDALGVTATADGARLRCGFQKLEGQATPEGLWLESTKPGAAGRLRLTATALGRAGLSTLNPQLSTALATTGKVSVDGKLVQFTRPGLTEEYSVSVDGVRQDFIIVSPPLNPQRSTLNPSAGDLRVELALSGARAEPTAGGARLRLEGSGRAVAYSRLRVADATGRELTARLEVLSSDRLAVTVADANAIYPVRIDPTFSDADWVSLGSGMNGDVNALAVSGTKLYAGGGFTTAGGVAATNIAKWDGSAWWALGSGLNGGISALAVIGTNLYAGGGFSTAGGVPASNIAKWDGGTWSALGSGMNGTVEALAASGTDLYAGGRFTTAGGLPVNYIAKWNGSVWSALGTGMNGDVNALVASGTNLYAGGRFTTAGGVPATNIAKWDGSAWSALGSGMNDSVWALAASGTDLYAGGFFTTAGGVPATSIAKWNGSTWSGLGSGVTRGGLAPMVLALAVGGTNLYAGGYLITAGGLPANHIAQWNGSAWSALGSGVNDSVRALAAYGADHLFVGGNFSQAGTNVSPYIAQANVGSGPPVIVASPASLAVPVGATADFQVAATGSPLLVYQWVFNGTNAIDGATSAGLSLANVQLTQAGAYSVTVSNLYGVVTSAPAVLTVTGVPPVIVASPASLAVLVGATADFQVAAIGSPLLVYQWVFNGTNAIDGATSAGLSLANVQLTQAGAYSVTVSNLYGVVTSAPAMLTVTGVPPVIVASPASLAVPVGATADFQVAATGAPPLVYQWVLNGTAAIAGATSSVLSLTNVQLTQVGAYSVTVSNLYGAVTSAPALLQVFPRGIVVTNSEANLRAAMSVGGTVTFGFDGTILLANTITNVISGTTLDGSGHQVTISGYGAPVFSVNANVSFTVVNLVVADTTSLGGSGILNLGGTVNLTGVTFRSNTATLYIITGFPPEWHWNLHPSGGAIDNVQGTVNATNCSFVGNVAQTKATNDFIPAEATGGAIRNEAGQVYLRGCVFVGNRASGGAGHGMLDYVGDPAFGGAIHNSGTVTLDLCAFAANSATGGDGYGYGPGLPFYGFPGYLGGEGSGGAIFNQGTLTVDRTTLCGNTAKGGSGGWGCSGVTMSSSADGYAGGSGGGANGAAICNLGSLWVTRSTFANNVVTGGVGGAGGAGVPWNDIGGQGGPGGWGGSGLGGALFNSGAASLVNCTIAFNTGSGGTGGGGGVGGSNRYGGPGGSGGNGGAGLGGVHGTCNLTNCTIAWNLGNRGPGGTGGAGGSGWTYPASPGRDGTSGAAWGGTACGPMPNTLIASNSPAGGDSFTDPKLGPLADNGGPTLTMALLPGSPAIDAGNTSLAPATDQRGFPRPAGLAADIGAFEYGSVMPTLAISRSGATGLNILASGNAGKSCRLLWSTNLSSWVPLATTQIGGDGTILFYDTCAPGGACRFYRLVMP